MDRKELILKDLDDGYDCLFNALTDLKIVNTEEQFDYCTSAKLSNMFDKVEAVVNQIGDIVYQK